jgi:alanyl-tRNA synthetase
MPTPTRRLYYDDAFIREFPARILHCEVLPPDVNSGITGTVWGLVLDRTAFYPTSGGQPHDLGKIGEANVLDVHDDGDEIIHVVDRKPESPDVIGCINWPRRFDHMQQHTGQHLLSAMFQERFGLPTVSFHLGAELSTIDLRGPEPTDDILEGAERAANRIIFENRPIHVRYGTAEQLAEKGVRKQVDREGLLRAIEIESADLQPCGGTHVSSTGQIGLLLVRRVSKVRQDWRVEFACGARAEEVARHDFLNLRRAAEILSCAPEEVAASAERAVSDRDTHYRYSKAALQRLAEVETILALQSTPPDSNGLRIVSRVFDDIQPEFLGYFAAELAKNEKTIALLARTACGHVFFAQHHSAAKDMSSLMKRVFERVPGKGGGSRDFTRGRLADPSRAQEAIDAARTILAETQSKEAAS